MLIDLGLELPREGSSYSFLFRLPCSVYCYSVPADCGRQQAAAAGTDECQGDQDGRHNALEQWYEELHSGLLRLFQLERYEQSDFVAEHENGKGQEQFHAGMLLTAKPDRDTVLQGHVGQLRG